MKHGVVGAEMLTARGIGAAVVYAVKSHNEALGFPRESLLDQTLFAIEGLSGLITAAVGGPFFLWLIRDPEFTE